MNCMNISSHELPPGFRFHPTDQELILHYLKNKVSSSPISFPIIADIDLYKFNPWDLPGKAFFGESEWFFFSPRDRKYPNGARPNRAAASGYWKATGTDKPILCSKGSKCLGVKKALVFYKGRPPKGVKTDWIMYEYRLLDIAPQAQKFKGSMRLDDWVLCRIRKKSSTRLHTGEKPLQSCVFPSINGEHLEKQAMCNNFFEGSDHQLLAYLLGSQQDNSDSFSRQSMGYQGPNRVTTNCNTTSLNFSRLEDQHLPVSYSVQNVLDSIKRTLSLGALDEQALLPPSKKLHCGSDSGDEQSFVGATSFPYFS